MYDRSQIRLVLAVVFAIASVSGVASAQDGKVYPGSNCHAYNSSSGAITQYGFNYVESTSTTNSDLLICPAVKDDVFSAAGVSNIRIRYCKPSTTGFYCSIHSKNSLGAGAGFTSNQWDFGAAGCKTMTLPNVLSFSEGSYQLYCILPPKVGNETAKLHTYRLDEV